MNIPHDPLVAERHISLLEQLCDPRELSYPLFYMN